MLKKEEIEQADSPWNKTAENEPVFILVGRDNFAHLAIRAWINEVTLRSARPRSRPPEDQGRRGYHQAVHRVQAEEEPRLMPSPGSSLMQVPWTKIGVCEQGFIWASRSYAGILQITMGEHPISGDPDPYHNIRFNPDGETALLDFLLQHPKPLRVPPRQPSVPSQQPSGSDEQNTPAASAPSGSSEPSKQISEEEASRTVQVGQTLAWLTDTNDRRS